MKVSILLFLLTTFHVSASLSQEKKLDLNLNEKTLFEVIKTIEQKSGYRFFYSDNYRELNDLVSINVKDENLHEVLSGLLQEKSLSFKILDDNVVIIGPIKAFQQQKLTGSVNDAATNEPIVGANVIVEGTTIGTITDINGKFSIDIPVENAVIAVSFLGYNTEHVNVSGQTTLNVKLVPDITKLEEVVVIGYGTVRKKDLTTSVSSVKMEDTDKKTMSNVTQAIEGKVSGVTIIQASGKPSGNFSIQIRGATSISSSNNPLYVVDGLPTDGIGNLNPADIESMQILKDASSCAIYGARAANGVVLITTKHGVKGKPVVSLRATYGISNISKKLDVLNAKQAAQLFNDERLNAGLPVALDPDTIKTDNNWQDIIYSQAVSSDVQLSFSGGNDKTKFYVSADRLRNDGIIKPSTYERYTFKLNLDHEMYKWLEFGTNLNLSKNKSKDVNDNQPVNAGGTILGALSTPPFVVKYTPEGYFGYNTFQGNDNPLASMFGSDSYSRSGNLLGNIFAKINILPNLSFKTSYGLDAYFGNYNNFVYVEKTAYAVSTGGGGNANTNQGLTWLNENILDFNRNFDKHKISAVAGFTTQKFQGEETWLAVKGFPNSLVETLNAASTATSFGSNAYESSLISYLGRISYSYDDKYLLSANFRRDGSSKFGSNNKYGNFPSVSVGWRLSREPFLIGVEAINDLKLRVSYGLTGNQSGIDNYAHLSRVGLGALYPFNGAVVSGLYPSALGNESLKWESTRQTDIGLDLTMFDSRITFTVDAYLKKTSDALLYVNLPLSTGYWNGIQNFAKVENKGLEFEVSSRNLTGEFKWSTDLNISMNRNNIAQIAGGSKAIIYTGDAVRERGNVTTIREGHPMSEFYGFRVAGVNTQTGDIDYIRFDGSLTDGQKLNPDSDRFVIGNPNPKFVYGITNSFTYKGFNLSVLLQGVYGNKIYNASRVELEAMEGFKNASVSTLNRWKQPGDITDMPRANFGSSINSLNSDRFIEDGSYLRVKNITLSYDFDSDLLKRIMINNLNIFITGQNLLTFTKYTGYDPEVSRSTNPTSLGVDYGTYPNVRIYTFGVNVTF